MTISSVMGTIWTTGERDAAVFRGPDGAKLFEGCGCLLHDPVSGKTVVLMDSAGDERFVQEFVVQMATVGGLGGYMEGFEFAGAVAMPSNPGVFLQLWKRNALIPDGPPDPG